MKRRSKRDRLFGSRNDFYTTDSDEITDRYKSFHEATGNLYELVNIDKIATKEEFWIRNGFTKMWIGQNSYTGEWFSAFYNPITKDFSGGHISSRNDLE